MPDPETRPYEGDRDGRILRLVALGLGGVVVLGVVVGLLLSWVGTSVLDAAGIDGGGDDRSKRPVMNDPVQTTPSTPSPSDPPTSTTQPPEPTTTRTNKPTGGAGSLVASPQSAASFERVTLTGRLPGVPAGTSLQVQRFEGGNWVPFPTGATAAASGSFSTYVELGQLGPNRMRVVVPGSSTTSPPVTIEVG